MRFEVKILLPKDSFKNENGAVLENLIRFILEKQEYSISQNIHFTGLEIDLIAKHKVKNELLYVECKAKEKPKSTEIKNFVYGVDYGVEDHVVDYGYFVYTEELDRQAGALKLKIEASKKNITFLGPEKIIQLLISAGVISHTPGISVAQAVTKTILVCTSGSYYYLLVAQDGALPSHALILDAKDPSSPLADGLIDEIKGSIKDVTNLEVRPFINASKSQSNKFEDTRKVGATVTTETITEIKESEHWYDYSPASVDHFIGRNNLRKEITDFIDNVRHDNTKHRIFYLDGKSGWGKSSLIAELRGRSKRAYWKKKLFVLAIDTRSAVTSNFVAYTFKKLLDDIKLASFLPKSLFSNEYILTSPYDVLSDETIRNLFQELQKRKKVIVIVFDQFEDVFRKEDLFETFYKFLLDVNDFQENLIVGFSWKSEINIPIDNPAYHLFSQVKDYAISLKIPEFSLHDVKSVIRQLEQTIEMPLGNELERRLTDASQGFPWLIKKLCIHTYSQSKDGKTIEDLVEQDLNIRSLFDSDLEKLSKDETVLLRFIARKSVEENSYDISEVEEASQDVLNQLIHKRLVIKTGTRYNIYWDIFRDYLVTGDIPVIGESFLIRQSAKACFELFMIFKDGQPKSHDELIVGYPTPITKKTLWNILFDLRSIGLIKRKENTNSFELTNKNIEVSKDGFADYITTKFQSYTPYIELMKIDRPKISLDDVVQVLKSIFKTSEFKDITWKSYGLNLVLWIKQSNLELKRKIIASKKGRGSHPLLQYNLSFYNTPAMVLSAVRKIQAGESVKNRVKRDLFLLGILTVGSENNFHLNEPYKHSPLDTPNSWDAVIKQALKFKKVLIASEYSQSENRGSATSFISQHPETVAEYNTQKSKVQIASVLLSWARFCTSYLDPQAPTSSNRSKSLKTIFDYSSPTDLKRIHHKLTLNNKPIDKLSQVKINLLKRALPELIVSKNSEHTGWLSESFFEFDKFFNKVLDLAVSEPRIKAIRGLIDKRGAIGAKEIILMLPELFSPHSSNNSKYNACSRLLLWAKAVRVKDTSLF